MTIHSKPPVAAGRLAPKLVPSDGSLAIPAGPQLIPALPSFARQARRKRRWGKWLARFIFLVIPAALAAYYALYAAPKLYESEARFAIRGVDPASNHGGGLGAFLGGSAGFMLDGYAVRDFLQSTDALAALDQSVGFTSRMTGKTDDWYFQLPAGAKLEERMRYYLRNVSIYYSLTEQVVVVKSNAFAPADAQAITARLVQLAEMFANDANLRARNDTLKLAAEEVAKAEARLTDARLAVNAWRQTNQNIDPTQNIAMVQTIIAQLETKLAEARAEMAEISAELGAESQRRKQLAKRIEALEAEIAAQMAKLVNKTDSSASEQLLEYERLQIQVEFATKQLLGAQAAMDEARLNATRQQKYVSQIVAATLPESPSFPRPVYMVAAVFVISLVGYGILSLVFAMVRETHI